VRENACSSTPVFDLSNVKVKDDQVGDAWMIQSEPDAEEWGYSSQAAEPDRKVEVPEFWILAWNDTGELEEAEGFWTKADRRQRAIDLLEDNWSVTYSTVALMAEQRIQEVLEQNTLKRQRIEQDIREHQRRLHGMVGCERCSQLVREYRATLSPSERTVGDPVQNLVAKVAKEQEGIDTLRRKLYRDQPRRLRFQELQAEWIDLQVSYSHMSNEQLKEAHGRWLYNLKDEDKRIWNEFIDDVE
jgi:hypothetical protein